MNHRISEINSKVVFVAGDVFSRRLYQQLDLDAACPFCRDGGFNGTAHGLYSRSHEGMNFLPYVYDAKPRACDVDQLVAAHLDRVTAAGNRRIAICPLFVSGLPGREADAVLMKAVYKWLEHGGETKVDRLFVVDFCRYCNLVDHNL